MINEKCRKLLKRVAFYTVDCRDSCGEIFVDLHHHRFSKVIMVPHLSFHVTMLPGSVFFFFFNTLFGLCFSYFSCTLIWPYLISVVGWFKGWEIGFHGRHWFIDFSLLLLCTWLSYLLYKSLIHMKREISCTVTSSVPHFTDGYLRVSM